MALKLTKLDKWQRNVEKLERQKKWSAESEATDERSKPVLGMVQPKQKSRSSLNLQSKYPKSLRFREGFSFPPSATTLAQLLSLDGLAAP